MTEELTYPHVYDEWGFSIDITPSTKFYQSYDKDGHPLVYSATHEECAFWTQKLLKARQDGGWTETPTSSYNSIVAGKL